MKIMYLRDEIKDGLYKIFDEANLIEEREDNKVILCNDIDSIQVISIIVEIEEKFQIEIPDTYLSANIMEDFDRLVDMVEELLAEQK